jgi:hypothetical protein
MPSPKLHIHAHMALSLFELLGFRTGRPFAATGAGADGWSEVVWDLITVGLNRAFNRKASNWTNTPAHAGGVISFADGAYVSAGADQWLPSMAIDALGAANARRLFASLNGAGSDDMRSFKNEGDDGGGVSVMLIETREAEGK